MAKNRFILTGRDGRPSTLLVYTQMCSGVLVQRRQVYKGKPNDPNRILKKEYYRVFDNNSDVLQPYPIDFDFTGAIIIRWGTQQSIKTT